jgi:hypothetical protein
MHRPDKMGSRRISQFGKDADKLAVKLFWFTAIRDQAASPTVIRLTRPPRSPVELRVQI